MKKNVVLLSCILLYLINIGITKAQTKYVCQAKSSKVTIKGTSTLHDWEVESTDFNSWALIDIDDHNNYVIQEGEAIFYADEIKSESSLMDKKTHDALKSDKYPNITFIPNQLTRIPHNIESTIPGNLTIAGVTNEVNLPVTLSLVNHHITISSKLKIKLSDYGIKLPTAMFGTIKCGNEVIIESTLLYEIM